jgi:uncharacterized membrane protein YczE
MCAVGVSIMGLGVGMLRFSDFSLDPFNGMINGFHKSFFSHWGISFGSTFSILCVVILSVSLIFDRSKIGIGTVINMFIPGYISEFPIFLLNLIPATGAALLIIRITGMLAGIIIICFGTGIYFNTNVGTSPYDAVALIMSDRLNKTKQYRFFRIGTDIICLILGIILGSIPGIATVLMVCAAGPLMSFFRNLVYRRGKRTGFITWL